MADTPYMTRLREQIAHHEREAERLTAERDRAYGETSDDPAVARLSGSALRQHHRHTDRDLVAWTGLNAQINSHEHGAAWKRARLAKHEAKQATP